MRVFLFLSLVIISLIIEFAPLVSFAQDTYLPKIELNEYVGMTAGKERVIRKILEKNIRLLAEKFSQKAEGCQYLRNLVIEQSSEVLPATNNLKLEHIRKEKLLMIMTGLIQTIENNDYVESEIYINDYGENKEFSYIDVKTKFSPNEVRSLRDSHSLIISYVLAMEAKHFKRSKDVIAVYLVHAQNIANDLPKFLTDSSSSTSAIPTIVSEINKELELIENAN